MKMMYLFVAIVFGLSSASIQAGDLIFSESKTFYFPTHEGSPFVYSSSSATFICSSQGFSVARVVKTETFYEDKGRVWAISGDHFGAELTSQYSIVRPSGRYDQNRSFSVISEIECIR